MSAKKRSGGAEFLTFVKNHLDEALTLNVGFGALERMDEMGDSSYDDLRDNIRARYCRSADDDAQFTGSPSPRKDPPSGAGGFDLGGHEEL